jgi:hypothetical protein
MEWYGPLTVLPSIGLLVLSTSNFIVSLNNELTGLEKDKEKYQEIIRLKILQLKKLGIANSCLYGSALLFLVAGMLKAVTLSDYLFFIIMFSGVITTTAALVFLFIHSLNSVQIRQKHLKI